MIQYFQYDDMAFAIYNLDWYRWRVKEQMDLIPIIGFLQRPPALKAIVDELTLQWYAGFMKAAYSMGTVMAKLS